MHQTSDIHDGMPGGAGREAEAPARPGGWLTQQRQARGWAPTEMARRLRETAREVGDQLPVHDALVSMIRRWERGAGVSERYRLHFCRALGIPAGRYGVHPVPPVVVRAEPETAGMVAPVPAGPVAWPGVASPVILAYRERQDGEPYGSWMTREVLMAAHEGSEQARQAEEHGIGEATLGQLRADVERLAHLTDTGEPFAVFLDLRRVRERGYGLLERRLWPREQVDVHFLLGCLNGLMGVAARRLGYPDAAEELTRAGWAHASAAGHRPLLAHLRYSLCYVAYWRGRTIQSRDLALSGLEYLKDGRGAADLNLKYAQNVARLGEADEARRAVLAAHDAMAQDYSNDLLEIGGQFTVSWASHHCEAGRALAEVRGAESQAAEELHEAIALYDAGPTGDEEHWFGGKALAGIELAVVRLRAGALDAATAALGTVFALPSARRVSQVTQRLGEVRAELAAPVFRGSAPAMELHERIEEFGREALAAGLHTLTGGPG